MEQEFSKTTKDREKYQEDSQLFGTPEAQQQLQQGLEDMYFLLSREYPFKASLALVGNRHQLVKRQQTALQGMACSAVQLETRKRKEVSAAALKDKAVYLDAFNVLILLETALSGNFVFRGLDGCFRDISSVHGSYRKVDQTEAALLLAGNALRELGAAKVTWVFDAPVSNSGKMKGVCYELAAQHGFTWEAVLEASPDKFLIDSQALICSSDAWILDECTAWFNLGAYVIEQLLHNQVNMVPVQSKKLY
ncbi:DUF434 domain-containing protein [Chitinophaga pinensis]|uniref:DUF434 domain-containing protein n=1 Tax=Chitinophaga pinensis (strain ATCC 43595 / DSM 2588 / LMG 13176 / NBRC 15968 / NCIMB 11800 / UQM 2034) TaxID=485918 RepID=A0A979G8S7_CHIPD|nr:DUF434 domain-containing protein [Chitinophaga pinensis]ACU63039.1 protein of unknown function DUF434 [Chitinophaga pinensis DSM 2588]